EDLLQGGHRRLEDAVELRELLHGIEEAREVAEEGHHDPDREVPVEHQPAAEPEDERGPDRGQELDAREVEARETDRLQVRLAVAVVPPAEAREGPRAGP